MRIKPLSINYYAGLFIGIFLLVLFGLGLLTHLEVMRLERHFHLASQKKASQEIEQTIVVRV